MKCTTICSHLHSPLAYLTIRNFLFVCILLFLSPYFQTGSWTPCLNLNHTDKLYPARVDLSWVIFQSILCESYPYEKRGEGCPQRRVKVAWQTFHTSLAKQGEPISSNRSAPQAASLFFGMSYREWGKKVWGKRKGCNKKELNKGSKCKKKQQPVWEDWDTIGSEPGSEHWEDFKVKSTSFLREGHYIQCG